MSYGNVLFAMFALCRSCRIVLSDLFLPTWIGGPPSSLFDLLFVVLFFLVLCIHFLSCCSYSLPALCSCSPLKFRIVLLMFVLFTFSQVLPSCAAHSATLCHVLPGLCAVERNLSTIKPLHQQSFTHTCEMRGGREERFAEAEDCGRQRSKKINETIKTLRDTKKMIRQNCDWWGLAKRRTSSLRGAWMLNPSTPSCPASDFTAQRTQSERQSLSLTVTRCHSLSLRPVDYPNFQLRGLSLVLAPGKKSTLLRQSETMIPSPGNK